MKNLLYILLIGLISLSCNENKSSGPYQKQSKLTVITSDSLLLKRRDSIFAAIRFDTLKKYKEPICLKFENGVRLNLGESIQNKFMQFVPYKHKANTDELFPDLSPIDIDYEMEAPYYHFKLNGRYAGGGIFLFTYNNQKVFGVRASWVAFDDDSSKAIVSDFIDTLQTKFFPCLKGAGLKFENFKVIRIKHSDFVENFRLSYDTRARPYSWNFDYWIEYR